MGVVVFHRCSTLVSSSPVLVSYTYLNVLRSPHYFYFWATPHTIIKRTVSRCTKGQTEHVWKYRSRHFGVDNCVIGNCRNEQVPSNTLVAAISTSHVDGSIPSTNLSAHPRASVTSAICGDSQGHINTITYGTDEPARGHGLSQSTDGALDLT